MKCGIYKITNPKGRIYIGQSKNISKRWNQYKYNYEYENHFIKNSIKKYGIELHKFEIVEICEENILSEKEIYWINFYKSNYKKYPLEKGMNFTDGGENPPIRILQSQITKNKISEKAKIRHVSNRIKNIHQYDLLGNLIKIWQPEEYGETKYSEVLKCCKNKKSYYKSSIWCFENILPIIKEKKIKVKECKNRKITSETKKKMSESHKKRWDEQKRKEYSDKFKGRNNYWLKGKKEDVLHLENRIKKIKKPINQYDLEGNFIKEWDSAKDIQIKLGFTSDYISLNARGKIKQFKNFIWKYAGNTKINA